MKYSRSVVLGAVFVLSCGSSSGEPSDVDSGDIPSGVIGSGGAAADLPVPPDRAPKGWVSVVGSSARVGDQVSYVFRGSDDVRSGEERVVCSFIDGSETYDGWSILRIGAGFGGEIESVVLGLRGSYLVPGQHLYGFDAEDDGPVYLRARMTLDDPDVYYEYVLGSVAGQFSSCIIDLGELSDNYIKGSVSCRDLLPSTTSLDWYDFSLPLASVSVSFECPLSASAPSGSGGSDSGGEADASGGSDNSASGGASLGGKCTGFATSCSLLSSGECSRAAGCRWNEDCSGISSSCYAQFSSSSCYSQEGCYWSSLSDGCAGSSWSCSLFSSSLSCIGQKGCYWDEECTGVPNTCSTILTQASCLDQPGCSWE